MESSQPSLTQRKPWPDFWHKTADDYSEQSTCLKAGSGVGAVIVKFNRLIGAGFNGSPPGEPHCIDEGCLIEPCTHWYCTGCNADVDAAYLRHHDNVPSLKHPAGHCKRTIHAEINAITNCLINPYGGTIYVTHQPCVDCAAACAQAGLTVSYRKAYP